MCGPKFCSMKITQEVRDAAGVKSGDDGVLADTVRLIDVEAEMAQKAKEFRDQAARSTSKSPCPRSRSPAPA